MEKELVGYGLLGLLAAGLVLHSVFPRYDWKTVEQPGAVSVIVYDKWTGRFQRGVYNNDGNLNVMSVFTPF